jgi:hypothetical protein
MTVTHVVDRHAWIGTETVETPFGEFEFVQGYPTPDAARRLVELRTFNRALEVYAEQMPAVSMAAIRSGLAEFGARAAHQVVVWKTLMDARTLLLTGNSETVYALAFLDVRRDGPTVVEVPPMMLGTLSDMWQHELAGIGPTGVDKGKGGKFLVLPPDYQDGIPPGYFAVRSRTYGVLLGLRGFQVDGKPDTPADAMQTIKIYPHGTAATPPPMEFLDGSGGVIDTVFPDSFEFFEDLARLIEQEPSGAVSSHERFLLASIGIEKGRSFHPDANLKRLLAGAARLGSAIARANTFASSDPERVVYQDRRWEWAFIGGSASWDSDGYVNIDRRAAFAYAAIGMSPAMVPRVVGSGSQYLWTMRDASGEYLDGGRGYRLRLPAKIPVKTFWSVVAYDSESRSMIENGRPFPTVSQYTAPAVNPDGSVDVFFGPRAPRGKEKNWIETVEGRGWFTLLRFYGPTQAFFDQTWKPGDIEVTD